MASGDTKSKPVLGFLTVVEHQQHGLFGGYLLLNTAGRPLEFHCTAPIRPNRAQQILYGPTLESFLYGEQIGRTLLEKAKLEPSVVFTDRKSALAVREHVSLPVALVVSADCSAPEYGGDSRHLPQGCPGGPGLKTFQVGRNRLAVPEQCDADHQRIVERLALLPECFDLGEPFGRIREAIEEAQQAARPSSCPAA